MVFKIEKSSYEPTFSCCSFVKKNTEKSVRWLRSDSRFFNKTIRLIGVVALVILLSISIFGIPFLYLGIKEWKKQTRECAKTKKANAVYHNREAGSTTERQPPLAASCHRLATEEPKTSLKVNGGDLGHSVEQQAPILLQRLDEAYAFFQEQKKRRYGIDLYEAVLLYKIAQGYRSFDQEKAKSVYVEAFNLFNCFDSDCNFSMSKIIYEVACLDESVAVDLISTLENNGRTKKAFDILIQYVSEYGDKNVNVTKACKEKFDSLFQKIDNNTSHSYFSRNKALFASQFALLDKEFFIQTFKDLKDHKTKYSLLVSVFYEYPEFSKQDNGLLEECILELKEIKESKKESCLEMRRIDDYLFALESFKFLYLNEGELSEKQIGEFIDKMNLDQKKSLFCSLGPHDLKKALQVAEKIDLFCLNIHSTCSYIKTMADLSMLEPFLKKLDDDSRKVRLYLSAIKELAQYDLEAVKEKLIDAAELIDRVSKKMWSQEDTAIEKKTISEDLISFQNHLIKLYDRCGMRREVEELIEKWSEYRAYDEETKIEDLLRKTERLCDTDAIKAKKQLKEIKEMMDKRVNKDSFSSNPEDFFALSSKIDEEECFKMIDKMQAYDSYSADDFLLHLIKKRAESDLVFALKCLKLIKKDNTKLYAHIALVDLIKKNSF